ncbi:MAG: hypothetical protein JNN11_03750 [Candidatus Doudnabacteria bacterium]|nr:hypothetical protein [Candidatus Doudnabacteria bacterium]
MGKLYIGYSSNLDVRISWHNSVNQNLPEIKVHGSCFIVKNF